MLILAALPLVAISAGQEAAGQNRASTTAQAKKPECVPADSDKGPKANPCPPGYVPAPGSKVPPLGSTDIGGTNTGTGEGKADGGKSGGEGAGGGKGRGTSGEDRSTR